VSTARDPGGARPPCPYGPHRPYTYKQTHVYIEHTRPLDRACVQRDGGARGRQTEEETGDEDDEIGQNVIKILADYLEHTWDVCVSSGSSIIVGDCTSRVFAPFA